MIKTSADRKLILSVPKGAEGAVRSVGHHDLNIKLKRYGPGMVVVSGIDESRRVEILNESPRWSFGSFVPFTFNRGLDVLLSKVQSYVDRNDLHGKSYWVTSEDDDSADVKKLIQGLVKQTSLTIKNNPADYDLVFDIRKMDKKIIVLLGRSFSVKKRFDYRVSDVSASINPVLAALLVRLMPKYDKGIAVDPTCGSGTLLYERLLYSEREMGFGIDRNAKALDAAKQNITQGALVDIQKRTELINADSTAEESWRKVDCVVCNLPFGVRLKMSNQQLISLYTGILKNAMSSLNAKGRILVVTSFKYGIENVIKSQNIKIYAHYKIWSGGLVYQTYILGKT